MGEKEKLLISGGRVIAPERLYPLGWVLVADGRIAAVGAGDPPAEASEGASLLNAAGLTVSPGFIDLHVHGGGGGDPLAGAPDGVLAMARFHAAHGTTGLLVTTGALPQDDIVRAVRLTGAAAMEPDGANILGVHLEGPYLSRRHKGAQPEEFIREPSVSELEELLEVCPGFIRLVTIAPELPGALAAIAWLCERGVRAAIGHTDATYAEVEQAVTTGARHAAHTFNAMRGLHHREPGAVGAVLLDDRLTAELIMDSIHVRPEVARLLVYMKGPGRICLITDAVAAAGAPEGDASLFGRPIRISGGAARLPDGALAGSTLTMERAVANMVTLVGVSLVDAVRMASLTPAHALGLDARKGSLAPGKDADIVLLDDAFTVRATLIGGRIVSAARSTIAARGDDCGGRGAGARSR